ncbi:hypothetical protein ACFQ1S_02930 [Kibdelosporangium lantanae]|uniref:DUF1877 domain-containing protein n=1 Tax=Kibdelosporangium lantanae TaxID=1497396 RepID=A0ABW3M3Q9_9PSEU
MAIDADYQAIPYEPLVARGMLDREAAETLQFFRMLATEDLARYADDPLWLELAVEARRVAGERPEILDRTLRTRAWDAVYWLLSPNRRAEEQRDPQGLGEIAVFGAEEFPCGAKTTQGFPLRFVRPETASTVADYVESLLPQGGGLFDAAAMEAVGVYKEPRDRDHVVGLLDRYVQLYRVAADLNECVLVALD